MSNRDRVYGMEWAVELVLRPASTILEERVTLSNRSNLRHRYYWWNNAGVQIWNDSRICYPMQFTASHGFKDIDTWPIDSSKKDMSLISNQTYGPVSRFVYGSREPFMGIYHPHTDAGVVHYANYAELPGKKIWTWGVDRDGLEWRNTLSDNDSAYAEVQAGLLRNQETYAFLEPRQAIRFSEMWMPVRGIGTITYANLHGVAAITRKTQGNGKITLDVGFNANHAVAGAHIEISDGQNSVFEETASLDPSWTWTRQIANLPPDAKYTFLLKSAAGETLLAHTEGSYDWAPRDQVKTGPTPVYEPPPAKAWGDGDFLSQGRDQELLGDPISAWETYRSGLAKFPLSFELLKSSGRVGVSLLRYEEASTLLAQAEARATWDPEIHYYRGIAEAALGHLREARGEFEAAHRSPSYRAAGGLLLAELLAQDRDVAGALDMLKQSCPAATGDLRCIEETVALERAAGDKDRARQLASESLVAYPTSSFLRNELQILGSAAPGSTVILPRIRVAFSAWPSNTFIWASMPTRSICSPATIPPWLPRRANPARSNPGTIRCWPTIADSAGKSWASPVKRISRPPPICPCSSSSPTKPRRFPCCARPSRPIPPMPPRIFCWGRCGFPAASWTPHLRNGRPPNRLTRRFPPLTPAWAALCWM